MSFNSWWGLLVNGRLSGVIQKDARPLVSDFGVIAKNSVQYEIEPVEIKREE